MKRRVALVLALLVGQFSRAGIQQDRAAALCDWL